MSVCGGCGYQSCQCDRVEGKLLEANVFVVVWVKGLACPECGSSVEIAIESWGDDGEPHSWSVQCSNDDEEGPELYGDDEECSGCGGSGFDYDQGAETGPQECEFCAGDGKETTGHRYYQSDWQGVIDQAEAWGKAQGFRVPS